MIVAGHRQAEGGHVLERLAKQAVKFLITGLDLDDVFSQSAIVSAWRDLWL
jgi:hypothetical protein